METPKGPTRVDLRIRESNQSLGRVELLVTFVVDLILDSADMTRCNVMDAVKRDIK